MDFILVMSIGLIGIGAIVMYLFMMRDDVGNLDEIKDTDYGC